MDTVVDVDPLPPSPYHQRAIAAKGNNEKCTKHIVPKIIGFPLFSYRVFVVRANTGEYWAKPKHGKKYRENALGPTKN